MKSIKTKMIVSISLSILIIVGTIISVVAVKTKDQTLDDAYETIMLKGNEAARQVQKRLEAGMDIAGALSQGFAGMKKSGNIDRDSINSMLEDIIKADKKYYGIWTIWEPNALDNQDDKYRNTEGHDETGRFVPCWFWVGDEVKHKPCGEYDLSTKNDYYSLGKAAPNGYITEPTSYVMDGKDVLMTSIMMPIKVDNKVLGVVGIDITLEDLQKLSDSAELYDTGYEVIVSNEGEYVTHKKTDLVGENIFDSKEQEIQDIKEKFELGEYFSIEGKSVVNNKKSKEQFIPITIGKTGTPWYIITVVPIEEITAKSDALVRLLVIIGIVGLLFLLGIIYIISIRISVPINKLSDVIGKMANYDLHFDKKEKVSKYLTRKDEIGIITNSVIKMHHNFIELVKNISQSSQQIASSTEELTATSQQSATAAGEVSNTIEEIARGANDQASDTQLAATNVNDLGQLIEKNNSELQELNQFTNEVLELKDQGIDNIKELVEITNLNNEATKEINGLINDTDESAKKIYKASQMISSIAEQTNLLALNAAIEAARAGEAGRGFAVVAEEIRNLAEQSDDFTGEITSVINDLKQKIDIAVTTMNEIISLADNQNDSVESTRIKFNGIAEAIEKTKAAIDELNESSKMMEDKKIGITQITENLSAISEENAAGTQEASASVEEQTASMEEIAEASESLAMLAEEMNTSISKFKY